ncbi:hypothetical protein CCB80_04705 [Armatimonadetes bacterium Uphvl-Ar1]|nr:hypothetical protein CCB80_04705 [Armatimonadetes bacterium Uphvl-Ar1]
MKQFLRRKWVRWVLGVVAALLVAFVGTAVLIWTSAGSSSGSKSDVAIVLGAAVWGEEPSPVFEGRLDEAVRLVASGMADQVIVTGGVGAKGGLSEAEVGKRYLVSKGVPPEVILEENRSRRTFDNLKNAKEIIERERLMSCLVVSDPLHMHRAMGMARKLGMDAEARPTSSSAYRGLGSRLKFLAREVWFLWGFWLGGGR